MEPYVAEILKSACQWLVLASIITALAVRYWQCRHESGESYEKDSLPKRRPGGELHRSRDLSGRISSDANTPFSYAPDELSLFSRPALSRYQGPFRA